MSTIGKIESLWRYPVKSMRGEELNEAFIGFSGVYGDRLFAFRNSAAPKGFPFLTAREQQNLLRYRPRFRFPDKAAQPVNLKEAESLGPGVTPLSAETQDLIVDVETPSGEILGVDAPELLRMLHRGLAEEVRLSLIRSERAMTDCRPVSLFSMQSTRQLAEELGTTVDHRRFRANVYLQLDSSEGFAEDAFVGRSLRIGAKVVIAILERDPRCKMITLDPDTGESNPALLQKVGKAHKGMAGVYGAVMVEGILRKNDPIELLN
jgi:uncharacterized protein YcbX